MRTLRALAADLVTTALTTATLGLGAVVALYVAVPAMLTACVMLVALVLRTRRY